MSYAVRVHHPGLDPATDVVLFNEFTPEKGQRLLNLRPASVCTAFSGQPKYLIRCQIATINPGASFELGFDSPTRLAGTVKNRAWAVAANAGSAQLEQLDTVSPTHDADLAVTLDTYPALASVGNLIHYRLVAENPSPGAAENVELSLAFATGSDVELDTLSRLACADVQDTPLLITFPFGELPADSSTVVNVTVKARSASPALNATASIQSDQVNDPDLTNNSAQSALLVNP